MRNGEARHSNRRHQGVIERLLPHLVCSIEKTSSPGETHVVDEDIDPAECLDRTIHQQLHPIFAGDIGDHSKDAVLRRHLNQLSARFLQGVLGARTDDYAASFRHKSSGAGETQPFARAGDNRNAVIQGKVHGRR